MDDATQQVTLGFAIPADVDLTSEQVAAYKATIVEALEVFRSEFEGGREYDASTAKLVSDLLMES
jgi:hypothetical protein